MKTVQIARDPFARETLVRRVEHGRETCAWCGNRKARFRYGVEPDAIYSRIHWDAKAFCCKGCRDTYYA